MKTARKPPREGRRSRLITGGTASRELEVLAQALRSIGETVVITDMRDRVLFVNDAFVKTYGYTREDLAGRNIEIVRSPHNPPELVREILPATLRGGWQGELMNRRKDGSDFPIQLSTSVVRDAGGHAVALIGVASDITQRKSTEDELRRNQMEMVEAQELAHVGSWIWDIAADHLSWSDELFRVYGLDPRQFTATYESFLERVHPDDRESVKSIVEEAYRGHGPFSFHHRILRPDGTVRTLHARGRVEVDGENRPVRMLGTGQDVTELRLAEEELRRAHDELDARVQQRTAELRAREEQHRAIADLASDYAHIAEIRPGGAPPIESVTEGFSRVTGYALEELQERGGWPALVHPDDRGAVEANIAELLAGRSTAGELRIINKAGETRWLRYSSRPVWDAAEQRVARILSAAQDITGSKLAEQAIRALSTPVLQLRPGLLLLPMVGVLDRERARQLTEQLLGGIRAHRARVVVIDITGVASVDAAVANHLARTIEASRLLGAAVILTGLSSKIAQTLVDIHANLSKIQTAGDLQRGIEQAEALLASTRI